MIDVPFPWLTINIEHNINACRFQEGSTATESVSSILESDKGVNRHDVGNR